MEKHALEAKENLERKYSVQISDGAFHLAVQGLKTFDSKLIFDDDYSKKAIDVLEGACKLVFDRFKNCAHEGELLEKAYQLRWALVELSELENEPEPDSDTQSWVDRLELENEPEPDSDTQSWVDRLRCERYSASTFMDEFMDTWAVVLGSSQGQRVLTPPFAENLCFFKDVNNYASSQTSHLDKVVRFLKDIRADLSRAFSPLLTVTCAHVAEVAIKLTDVPSTLILGDQKQRAIHMTNQRVVDQQHVISEIYETLAASSPRLGNTRGLFLLLGQSGAGKTEIAKAVAEHWYGDASRLAEIDVSDHADASEFRKRLTIVVAKRAYSVIVFDKIDKASPSVRKAVIDVLSNKAQIDDVDLSNSIVFMTHGPLIEAEKKFSDGLLDSVDKVLIVRIRNYKSVCRVLLREIVRERYGQGLVVHVSDAFLTFLVEKHSAGVVEEGGKALKRLLVEEVISWLPAGKVLDNNVVALIDRVAETAEVSIRYQRRGQSVDDWYFREKEATFEKAMANLRTKVESVDRILKLRSEHIPLLCWNGHGLPLRSLVSVCNDILMWSPFCRYGDIV